MRISVSIALVLAAGAAFPAFAQGPQPLGTFKDWSAFEAGTGSGKTCYALSQPKTMLPKKAKRDPAYFLISDWPGRHAKAEAEIVPGYKYKGDSTVTAEVGSRKFEFFTKNDADSGSAWVKELSDEAKLVDAMKAGAEVTVTGVSSRGTTTKDTYSLSGLTQALEKVHAACGM